MGVVAPYVLTDQGTILLLLRRLPKDAVEEVGGSVAANVAPLVQIGMGVPAGVLKDCKGLIGKT